MDSGLLKFILLTLPVALALPVGAQLSSQSSTFSATVPVTCNVSGGNNSTITMALTGLNDLQAGTSNIIFEANANVDLQLRALSIGAAPTGTSSYSWIAELRDSGNNVVASSDKDNASSLVNYSNGLTNSDTFTVWMRVAPPSGFFKPGTYTGTVVLDCLAH